MNLFHLLVQYLPHALGSSSVPPSVLLLAFNAIPLAVMSYAFWDQCTDYITSKNLAVHRENIVEEFDFIIVGGGSAGSVVANRLSKNGKYSVLLLEAGGNPNPLQSIPALLTVIQHTPAVDHEFYTVPQINACMALKEQKSYWPRGRGLGGTSNMNAMLYQRGNPNDYDRWSELSGSDEWKFSNVLKNFKNIEDYHGVHFNEEWHSKGGSGVHVSTSNEKRLLQEFLAAGQEMGYPTKDVNGFQEASFSIMDYTIKMGRRHGAYTAFVKPALNCKNLYIYRYAQVLRLSLDKDKRAYGLTYKRHGMQCFVRAKKEIILSAGAIDSAKILMLSGIGPKEHLEELGIKTVVNLPVGQNLQDHVMITFGPFISQTFRSTFNLERDVTLNMVTNYLLNGIGPLSMPLSINGVAYIYSDTLGKMIKATNASPTKVSPDIQLILVPAAPALYSAFEKLISSKKGYLASLYGDSNKRDAFFVYVILAKPKSRGVMRLSSANPIDKPLLDPKYFSHPDDINILVEGMNFTVNMIENTRAFATHRARLADNPLGGCEHHSHKSLQFYECLARHVTQTMYHPCGTCSMGKGPNDPLAVVDYKLSVLGTEGLRVVDASVIPEIPNSNINTAVYMLADKASEMILEYWNFQQENVGS